jgi:hypothetical protein
MYWHCREHDTNRGQADCLAFLLPRYLVALNPGNTMTQAHSKSRQQAEIAFGDVQSQFFARNSAVDELDSIVRVREEKTLRLREARLAKELQDRATATASLLAKRAKTA